MKTIILALLCGALFIACSALLPGAIDHELQTRGIDGVDRHAIIDRGGKP